MEWIRVRFGRSRVTSKDSTHSEGISPAVQPNELVAYFIRVPKHIDRKTGGIRPQALMPRRVEATHRLETSVYRTSGLSEGEVWEICRVWYELIGGVTAIGRGEGRARSVTEANLDFDADGKPHPRHANIIRWEDDPSKSKEQLKHFWMQAAQKFAPGFQYIEKPRPQGPQ